MPSFIDCWELVYGKGYKNRDGSPVLTDGDKASLLDRIGEHTKAGVDHLEAAKLSVQNHLERENQNLSSVYDQAKVGKKEISTLTPLANAWEKYDGTGEIQTVSELANHIEGLITEGKAPESLQSAVDKYRDAVEEDFKMAGRGELENDEAKFTKAIRKAVTQEAKQSQPPPSQVAPQPTTREVAKEPSTSTETKPAEIVGMGGATPSELTGGVGKDIYGIAERVREERARASQSDMPPRGEGISAPDSVDRGRQILAKDASAADKALTAFEADPKKAVSADGIAAVRAQGELLARIARRTEEKFGTDSPEYRAAWKNLSDWDARSKLMQTEWHKIGMAQQGETDIDTGTFTGLQRAFKEATGKEFDASQSKDAEKLAKGVREATAKAEEAKQKVIEEVKAEATKPEQVEPHVRLVADKLKDYFGKRALTALDRIKARRAQGRQYIGGIDPEAMVDYADYGASKILAKGIEGAEMTAEWAKEMVDELGDYIKPHLKDIWEASRKAFEAGFDKVATGRASKQRGVVLRAVTRDADQAALDAANKTVRENAIRVANAENKSRTAKTIEDQKAAKIQLDAEKKSLDHAQNKAREAAVKSAQAETNRRLKESETPEDLQAKAAKKALDAANEVSTRAAKSLADAENKARMAKTASEKSALQAAAMRAKKISDDAIKAARNAAIEASRAETKERVARANLPAYVWSKAREYIEKGMDDFDEIRNKIATDLGIPVDKVTEALGKPKGIKSMSDDMWRKQQIARRLDQQAKQWLLDRQTPAYKRYIQNIPRIMFGLKVGFHGTVALGTHAPMVAFQPRFWANYARDFVKMYRMVGSTAYYERQVQDLLRRPTYITARRAGLVNDPFQYEDYNSPTIAKYLEGMTRMGNRGYAVLKILRQDMFDQMWNTLPKTTQISEVAKAIADGVNHATGVVRMAAPKGSSLVLFAPRLEMSRVAWLATDPLKAVDTFARWKTASEGEKQFALNQIKEKAWVAGTLFSLLAINQGILSATDSKQKINFDDPFKGDFLKFKAAGMQMSYGNPLITMARLPVRLWKIRQSDGGKLKNVIYPDEDSYTVLGEYARTQLSPFASLITDLWFKSDWLRRTLPNSNRPMPKRLKAQGVKPYTWSEFWAEKALPIPAEEAIREVWGKGMGMSPEQIDEKLKALATLTIMLGTGARVNEDWTVKKEAPTPPTPPTE